jgi:hypothetical protein
MAASLFTIPINVKLPWQQFKITLSGVIFTLEIRYNGRMDRWVMNINDASGNQILQGIVLLISRDLTSQYVTLSIPTGVFFATDDTKKDIQPGQNSFGVDHSLFYVDPTA